MLTAPEKLNGYPVIQSEVFAQCITVMMLRDDPRQPFVVATWWPELKTTWSWGHYSSSRKQADRDFFDVSRRNLRR